MQHISNLSVIVQESKNFTDLLFNLGYATNGRNMKRIKALIKEQGICIGHFQSYTPRTVLVRNITEYLTLWDDASPKMQSHHLKLRLIKEGLLSNKCSNGHNAEWMGQPLSLHLDHINGNRYDNRLENLRLLCPNCHSQTQTYAGKNLRKPQRQCAMCNKPIGRRSLHCQSCEHKKQRLEAKSKIVWPSVVDVIKMVQKSSFVAVAKQLGVSDNAVRKYLRRNGIQPHTVK